MVKFLIAEGAAVSTVDGDGETAEGWAMKKGATKCAGILRAAAEHPDQFTRAAIDSTCKQRRKRKHGVRSCALALALSPASQLRRCGL